MYYFAAVQQTSTAKFYLFFQKFFKKVRDLRVNETKVIWEKALTVNLFALEREEKSKITNGPSLETAPGFLTCLLTHRLQMTRICGFLDCFSFSRFSDASFSFYILKVRPLNSVLYFT